MIIKILKNEDIIYTSKFCFSSLDKYVGQDTTYRAGLYDETFEGHFLMLVKNIRL